MLTADLARSRTVDGEVHPLFLDISEQQYRETAAELIEVFENHLGEPKGDLEDAIDELTIANPDYKIVQGLAKLLTDEYSRRITDRVTRARATLEEVDV